MTAYGLFISGESNALRLDQTVGNFPGGKKGCVGGGSMCGAHFAFVGAGGVVVVGSQGYYREFSSLMMSPPPTSHAGLEFLRQLNFERVITSRLNPLKVCQLHASTLPFAFFPFF